MSTPACRACGAGGLEVVLSLGELPLSNGFLTSEQLGEPEARYPLDLAVCSACGLAQITVAVDPVELFGEYAYFSSYSSTLLAHAEELVGRMIRERGLGPETLVMEIASNDGYLLQHYVRSGIPVLGIDPARNMIEPAQERGVKTRCAFFGAELAEELRRSGRRASILHANNVLAHVPDLQGVVGGVGRVLADDGIAIVETPYVRDLVERLEFDTIYHEHLYYYSLTALHRLFERRGLRIVDVERIDIHGGSLRVFAAAIGTAPAPSPAVRSLLEDEERLGIATPAYFSGLASGVSALRVQLLHLLGMLKQQGHSLAAYGAAAKGAILLNTLGIGRETIDFVADRSEYKQGRFMPGVRIPIVSPGRILSDMPDEVLVLAWNLADEILEQLAEYRERGGRFIIPLPTPEVIG
ncbi:MAG: class I SAM-dependent methyltransferase [Acidimicrobiales bacterium]